MDRPRNSGHPHNREFADLHDFVRQHFEQPRTCQQDRETLNQGTDQRKGKEPIMDASTGKATNDFNTVDPRKLHLSHIIDDFTKKIIYLSVTGKATSEASEVAPDIIELSYNDDKDYPSLKGEMKREEPSQRLFEKVSPTVLGSGQEENDKPSKSKSILKKPTESPKPKEDQSKQVRFVDSETNTFQTASQQEERPGKRKRQQDDQFPQIIEEPQKMQKIWEVHQQELESRQKKRQILQNLKVELDQEIKSIPENFSGIFDYFKKNPQNINNLENIPEYNELADRHKQLSWEYTILWELSSILQPPHKDNFAQNNKKLIERLEKYNYQIENDAIKIHKKIDAYFINVLGKIPTYNELITGKYGIDKKDEKYNKLITRQNKIGEKYRIISKYLEEARCVQYNTIHSEYSSIIEHNFRGYLKNNFSRVLRDLNENVRKKQYYRTINDLANRQYILHREIENNEKSLKGANKESNLIREYTHYFDILHSDIGNNEQT